MSYEANLFYTVNHRSISKLIPDLFSLINIVRSNRCFKKLNIYLLILLFKYNIKKKIEIKPRKGVYYSGKEKVMLKKISHSVVLNVFYYSKFQGNLHARQTQACNK